MLIPITWTAIVCLFTGMAVYYNCIDADEYSAAMFIAILTVGFSLCALMLCIACGM